MARQFRVGVIGSTGKGGYGHGLDTAFVGVENSRIVCVADDNAAGLQVTGKKLQVENEQRYADYRQMLEKEKPDVVCVGPRWVTDRVAMLTAVAEAGCHIYCEKPFVGDAVSAERVARVCRQAGIKLALAHQWRAMAPVAQTIRDVRAKKWGRLLRMYARPKDDSRGGGEELLLHGTHLFDMMIAMAGEPRWVAGHVTQQGRDITKQDARQGTEPVGPIAGDTVDATFGFDAGVQGYFASTSGLYRGRQSGFDVLFGLRLECEQALLHFRQPGDVYIYPAPLVLPDQTQLAWKKVWLEDWHFTPEHLPRPMHDWLHRGNQTLAKNLLEAIEHDREPLSSVTAGRAIAELVQGVYASHLQQGVRLLFPLETRPHPLV